MIYDPDLDAELTSFGDALRRLLSFLAGALTATRARAGDGTFPTRGPRLP